MLLASETLQRSKNTGQNRGSQRNESYGTISFLGPVQAPMRPASGCLSMALRIRPGGMLATDSGAGAASFFLVQGTALGAGAGGLADFAAEVGGEDFDGAAHFV
jgi:hypothetical protein